MRVKGGVSPGTFASPRNCSGRFATSTAKYWFTKMRRIYLSPYHSRTPGKIGGGGCSKSYGPLLAALKRGEWFYDQGDDPSFFSRRHIGGALTWGVCRPDARSQVQPGDVVVFFAFTDAKDGVEYRLSAIATVERKTSQAGIFLDPAFAGYKRYLNLLVKPAGGSGKRWRHHEPGTPEGDWHDDWLSRVVTYRAYDQAALDRLRAKERVTVGQTIGGRPFAFGENYVVFSEDPRLTFVLAHPPLVALAEPPAPEVWHRDGRSRSIFARTVAEARRHGVQRSLRIHRRPHPHSPPIRWEVSPEGLHAWRCRFIEFLAAEGLGELG